MKTITENNTLIIFLEGSIDAGNATPLRKEAEEIIEGNSGKKIIFDAENLTYISSAGLRMLLSCQKKAGNDKITVQNTSHDVYDIFEMTKFTDLMNIEKKASQY